jgi:O-antigen/teichoic acid export membrane protein
MTSVKAQETADTSARWGRAALPLIVSDATLQGVRYLFIVYLGYQSLSLLGSFLMGAALGSLLGVATDSGISQHWLRLKGMASPLTRQTFLRAIQGKTLFSLLGMAMFALLSIGGIWNIATPLAMVIGMALMTSQAIGDTCDAVGLSHHRYATVSLFRMFLAAGGYAVPLAYAFLGGQEHSSYGARAALVTAAIAGALLSCVYVWRIARALPVGEAGVSYREVWWESRWLGLNQLAIVVDVRAPLIVLGFMLGETAVGLYGLVQRTTGVVELAWASISRLLVTSYSELGAGEQVREEIRAQVLHAARLTGFIMAALAVCVWTGTFAIAGTAALSSDTLVALSLLKWGSLAIGLSSLKRPFISGLIATYQERAVCRVNMLSAVAGLLLVPLSIVYLDIWGPVVAWVILEAVACVVIVHQFLFITRTTQANPEPSLSQRAVL